MRFPHDPTVGHPPPLPIDAAPGPPHSLRRSFLVARNTLRTNAAEAIAQLTGGEFFHSHEDKDLKAGLIAVSNDVPNYYVLSFRPTPLVPGLHALHLEIKDCSHLVIKSRSQYWMDSDTAR